MLDHLFAHLEPDELNDARRAQAEGAFISLSEGICHYERLLPPRRADDSPADPEPGAAPNDWIVLIHGFSTPSFIWDPIIPALLDLRLGVLRYDLFGRGYSDRPSGPYTIHRFVRQLRELLDALDLRQPLHLVGLSMGGPIAARFAAAHPERVRSLILIAPAGAQAVTLWPVWLARLPLLPELLLALLGEGRWLERLASDLFHPSLVERFGARYRSQIRIRGFRRALLSTVRSGMLGSFLETYRQVGISGIPTLLLWGTDDQAVPIWQSQHLLQVLPQAEFHPIEGAGHLPYHERPEMVQTILADFLRRHAGLPAFHNQARNNPGS